MNNIIDKLNSYTLYHFNCSVRNFIEDGIKKGRHYFYLRDALRLSDKKFKNLLQALDFDIPSIEATKEQYTKLFDNVETPDGTQLEFTLNKVTYLYYDNNYLIKINCRENLIYA